jgi:YggT family protein
MSLLFAALAFALGLYSWVLLGRLFLDLITSINPQFRPQGVTLVLCEVIFTLTDPPLKFLRRFIKPVRFGAVSLDFGWTVLFIACSVLQRTLSAMSA